MKTFNVPVSRLSNTGEGEFPLLCVSRRGRGRDNHGLWCRQLHVNIKDKCIETQLQSVKGGHDERIKSMPDASEHARSIQIIRVHVEYVVFIHLHRPNFI